MYLKRKIRALDVLLLLVILAVPGVSACPVYNFTVSPQADRFSASNENFTLTNRTYEILNTGTEKLTGFSCAADYDWITVYNCPFKLYPGSKATITARFNTSNLAPGEHNATITISAANITRKIDISINVTQYVPPFTPVYNFTVSPETDSFNASNETGALTNRTYTLANTGNTELENFTCTPDVPWAVVFNCPPSLGVGDEGESANLTVQFDTSNLLAGEYNATITISAANLTRTISISITVTPYVPPITPIYNFTVSPETDSFNASNETGTLTNRTYALANTGNQDLADFTCAPDASWVTVFDCPPLLGTGENASVTVQFNTSSLASAAYDVSLNFSTENASASAYVSVTVYEPATIIYDFELSPSSDNFTAPNYNESITNRTYIMNNTGNQNLTNITCASNETWAVVLACPENLTLGNANEIIVSFNTSSLESGTHWLEISFSATGAPTKYVYVNVTVIIVPVIYNVSASSITTSSALITWNTDINSTSTVFHGTAPSVYAGNATSAENVTWHALSLSGLAEGTTYYYVVQSCYIDNCANSSESSFATSTTPPPVVITGGGGGGGYSGGGGGYSSPQASPPAPPKEEPAPEQPAPPSVVVLDVPPSAYLGAEIVVKLMLDNGTALPNETVLAVTPSGGRITITTNESGEGAYSADELGTYDYIVPNHILRDFVSTEISLPPAPPTPAPAPQPSANNTLTFESETVQQPAPATALLFAANAPLCAALILILLALLLAYMKMRKPKGPPTAPAPAKKGRKR
ncbi:MAG: hypothetical protein AB1468_00985 [Candidatus Micrarchaeota archaeon]